MTNLFTLDNIREAAQRKHAPVTIGLSDGTPVVLRGLLRLSKPDRKAVAEHMEVFDLIEEGSGIDDLSDEETAVMVEALSSTIEIIAENDGLKLVDEIDGDLIVLMELIEKWSTESQLGEAVSSPN